MGEIQNRHCYPQQIDKLKGFFYIYGEHEEPFFKKKDLEDEKRYEKPT